MDSGTSSRPPGALSIALTGPLTRTTDSRETAFTAARTASETFFLGMVTWMMPVRSRIEHEGKAAEVPDLVDPAADLRVRRFPV